MIPRAHSAVSLETPSSETASVDSSNRRHNSIPNGNILSATTGGHNHFTDCIGSGTITTLYSMASRSPQKDITTITISNCCNNNNSINNNDSSTANNNDSTSNSNNNLSTNSGGSTKKNNNRRLSIKEPSNAV